METACFHALRVISKTNSLKLVSAKSVLYSWKRKLTYFGYLINCARQQPLSRCPTASVPMKCLVFYNINLLLQHYQKENFRKRLSEVLLLIKRLNVDQNKGYGGDSATLSLIRRCIHKGART